MRRAWRVCPRDANLKREPLIEGIDGPVAAISNARALGGEKGRWFQIFESCRAKVMFALDGLGPRLFPLKREHGRDVQLLVAREILWLDDFIVRKCSANILRRITRAQRLNAVQPFPHGTVAIRVHMRLEAGAGQRNEQSA